MNNAEDHVYFVEKFSQEGRLGKQTVLIGPWVHSLSNKPIFAKFEFVAVQSETRKPSWFQQNRIFLIL